MNRQEEKRRRALNIALIAAAVVVVAVVLWLDFHTTLWQEVVILSGLVASLVTFLVTYLVIERLLGRAEARRWEPVTRLALTDLLHALASEEESELSRGIVVARTLPMPDAPEGSEQLRRQLEALRHDVVTERRLLTERLSVWAEFLSSTGDNNLIMQHVAERSLQLDAVRDAALQVEDDPTSATLSALRAQLDTYNQGLADLAGEIERRLEEHRLAAEA